MVPVLLSLPFLNALWMPMPACAAMYYVDPVNGSNAGDGLSPATAWKTPRPVGAEDTVVTLGAAGVSMDAPDSGPRSARALKTGVPLSLSKVRRVVLGAETVTGWDAHSETIWEAALAEAPSSVRSDGAWLSEGCAMDFLSEGEWFWDYASRYLYLNDPEGNPDQNGKIVTATGFDDETGVVSGWARSQPRVFKIPMSDPPMHLMVDGELHPEKDWWWGPISCAFSEQGEPGTLYMRSPAGNPDATGRKVEVVREGGGWSSASGDFNGDGFSDVVTSNLAGQVFVYFGGPAFTGLPDQVLAAPGGERAFGFQVASAGDVDRDGYDDLLVALDWGVNRVYLFWGSGHGLSTEWKPQQQRPFTVIEPPPGYPGYGFGHSLATHPGDINRDGFADILIGVGEAESYLCIYHGGSSRDIRRVPNQIIRFPGHGSIVNVSHVGDLNRDGYGDIAVSPSRVDTDSLSVLVYKGSRRGVTTTNPVGLSLPAGSVESFRNLVPAPAGDLNDDGYADLIIGNQWAAGRYLNEGKAYIYHGSRQMALLHPDVTIDNPVPSDNARFGVSVSGIMDFDHDGYNDFMIGCPYSVEGGFGAVYYGLIDGVPRDPSLMLKTPYSLGWSLAHIGNMFKMNSNEIILGDEFKTSLVYSVMMDQVTVRIDIKPNDNSNVLKRSERTAIPVAIFGSKGFNVRNIDVASLSLQGLSAKRVGNSNRYTYRYRDVNRDGFGDLVVSFANSISWPIPEDGLAVLSGRLFDQTPLLGKDLVSVVP